MNIYKRFLISKKKKKEEEGNIQIQKTLSFFMKVF